MLQLELLELPVQQPVFLGLPPLLHHFPPLLSILVTNVKTHINTVYKPARKVYFITNVRAYIIKGLEISFNKPKCHFGQSQITFYVMVIDLTRKASSRPQKRYKPFMNVNPPGQRPR